MLKPSEVVGRNVKAGRALRNMNQAELAIAMQRLGHQWSDKTVGSVENATRRLDVDELAALALCLGYVLPDLLAPSDPDRLEFGAGTMRPGFVHLWARGDIVVLLHWDADGILDDPNIQGRIGVKLDRDSIITAIELRRDAFHAQGYKAARPREEGEQ